MIFRRTAAVTAVGNARANRFPNWSKGFVVSVESSLLCPINRDASLLLRANGASIDSKMLDLSRSLFVKTTRSCHRATGIFAGKLMASWGILDGLLCQRDSLARLSR